MRKKAGFSGPIRQNYVTLDASATLALFMQNGWPEERLFLQVIGRIIESAAGNTPVRIYGEMVAVLWAEGNTLAAIHRDCGISWGGYETSRFFADILLRDLTAQTRILLCRKSAPVILR